MIFAIMGVPVLGPSVAGRPATGMPGPHPCRCCLRLWIPTYWERPRPGLDCTTSAVLGNGIQPGRRSGPPWFLRPRFRNGDHEPGVAPEQRFAGFQSKKCVLTLNISCQGATIEGKERFHLGNHRGIEAQEKGPWRFQGPSSTCSIRKEQFDTTLGVRPLRHRRGARSQAWQLHAPKRACGIPCSLLRAG